MTDELTEFNSKISNIIKDTEEKELLEIKELIEQEKRKRKDRWDINTIEEVNYFDPSLSYKPTGYRPIDDLNGLDFNPDWFTEARRTKLDTNHYTLYRINSKAYKEFWDEEYRRCRDGLTVNGYTVTGDHYFFLNYYKVLDLTSATKAGAGRASRFPKFFVEQYKWFHYLELCKLKRKDACIFKTRGCGYSEMEASTAGNTYNCRANSVTVIAAQQEIYLNKTLDKVWNNLTYLNDETDGAFFKLRQRFDSQYIKKASYYKMVEGQKIETGILSLIQGINADKPNKIRGDRTDLLIYEEGGSWPDLLKAFIQGDALVGILGNKFGIKVVGGTGGDKSSAVEGLKTIFFNPEEFNVLPYKHNHTETGEFIYSGFFIPAYSIVDTPECMDSRGYTNPEKGKEFYNKERDKKAKSPLNLLIYSAEYCFTPEEGFALEGENDFNKILIAEQIARIRIDKQSPKIERGILDYTFKNSDHSKENVNGIKWLPSPKGKVLILEHPLWLLNRDELKVPEMRNLYVAGIDGIDLGALDTSSNTTDPSDFCMVVKKRVYGNGEPTYVAIYKDRPNDIREAFKMAIKIAMYYNCLINLEASKVSILTWARSHGYIKYFMRRPFATLTDSLKNSTRTRPYGTPAATPIILHLLNLIGAYVEDFCHNIWFNDMLDELNRYSFSNKRKFDIIAAMGLCELGDEELLGTVPRAYMDESNILRDIGYYIDENGIKRYGVIPDRNKFTTKYNYETNYYNDGQTNRTSDPRRR